MLYQGTRFKLSIKLFAYIQFKGTAGFSIPLDDIRKHVPYLAGSTLHVYATVHDWFYGQHKSNRGICVINSDRMKLVILGGGVRVFKPEAPFNVYVSH